MELPKDPMMLFSFINMKLRDFYPSLDALCQDMQVSKEEIVNKLKAVGFEYNPEQKQILVIIHFEQSLEFLFLFVQATPYALTVMIYLH
mgnify:CR=1 FL=1